MLPFSRFGVLVNQSAKTARFGSQLLNRSYASTSSSGRSTLVSRRRNAALISLVLSSAGVSVFVLESYFSPKIHADVVPDRLAEREREDLSPRIRSILHGLKADTQDGVNVELLLKRCEETKLQNGTGVWRYDLNQLASNCPIEDDHAEALLRSPSGGPWHFWGIFDGHVSWETSAALRSRLIASVSGALQACYRKNAQPSSEDIDSAIKHAFVTLDNDFVYRSLERALQSGSRAQAAYELSQAWAGAVAMLAFYDQARGEVKVALTGDLRAVRGRRSENGKWETTVLTLEQDGDNEEEAARIRSEHPSEPDVIKDGRVLGFQPTRAFGDASLKWDTNTQKMLHGQFLGLRPRDVVKTPPYMTAEPVVTTAKVQDGDFLILACDGLWESLTSEEAVSLVGTWLEMHAPNRVHSINQKANGLGSRSKALENVTPGKEKTIRYEQWRIPKNFVHLDENAATHLIRNALGGADKETMTALLTRTGTLSRRLRDDISVTVVFFEASS